MNKSKGSQEEQGVNGRPDLSIVVPAFNEQDSIEPLIIKIVAHFEEHPAGEFEIIFVDDGSTDDTWSHLERLSKSIDQVRALRLARNFGKAAALDLGTGEARADIIITMDADLQDDPGEIPNLLQKLGEGYDLVVGWKRNRLDPLSKRLPSKLFNAVTAKASGLKLQDFNCGLKAARREVFQSISIYGELHRYIPVLAHTAGFRVTEIPVRHHPRQFGKSKYGFKRYLRGFLDLLTVITITKYSGRPGHLFGGLGVLAGLAGGSILIYLTFVKLVLDEAIGGRPLLLFGVLLLILAFQFLFFGILAELILNERHSRNVTYLVSRDTRTTNADHASQDPA
jgi:glycosyltransferase involved in cell wall biosynthesis